MTNATGGAARRAGPLHFAALLGGNFALAIGPLWVRIADCGPVSSAFWRLALALPGLALIAGLARQPLSGLGRKTLGAVIAAGLFFAADVGAWHIGIERTRLGNATLLGNSGSVVLVVATLIAARRWPARREWAAFAATLGGAAILLSRSLEISASHLVGDLFALAAGLLYSGYIILIQRARGHIGGWTLLFWSSLAGLPLLAGVALGMKEPFWPHLWWPVLVLALTSQIIGQGLLVYALRHFSALVIGLVLLSQPVVSVLIGWVRFGEALGPQDALGMLLVGAGLVLARSTDT